MTSIRHPRPESVTVTLSTGVTHTCAPGTAVAELLDGQPFAPEGLHIIGALVNNDVVSLSYPLEVDCRVEFLTLAHPHGWRIYRSSVSFLLAKAVRECFPGATFCVEHSLGTGFYCSFEQDGNPITEAQLAKIDRHMRDLVARDVPIERRKISFETAVSQFRGEGQWDKYNLLRFRNPPKIVIYCCDGFSDLSFGPMAYSTGALGLFKLIPYRPGFVVQFPDRDQAPRMSVFEEQPHLFTIFQEHKEWGRILGVQTVGQLNEIVANNEIEDFIKINEAFHEKKIARIADRIAERSPRPRFILVAGPSSAGKTTFAKRLGVQLRVNGLRPVTISVDNYFVDREHTPRSEDGEYDFEDIETIDLDLLNDHLQRLDRGEQVEIPRFDFTLGRRIFRGDILQVEEDQMVIMEGIHCLNPRLTHDLPEEHKFRIYISALTQLNLDFNNRISTTDNRLLRRLVRDHRYRGHSARDTLRMWSSVRSGEKKWIFPFQRFADATFNSALDYELAVLRTIADSLLAEVKPNHFEYAKARQMMQFIESFVGVSPDLVPTNSILREFIGQSSFRY